MNLENVLKKTYLTAAISPAIATHLANIAMGAYYAFNNLLGAETTNLQYLLPATALITGASAFVGKISAVKKYTGRASFTDDVKKAAIEATLAGTIASPVEWMVGFGIGAMTQILSS